MTPKAARAFRISVLDDKIEDLIQFHVRLESCLRLELARLPKDLAKLRQGLSPEKRELLEQMYSDEHYLLETVFARNLRYSTLVSSHSLLETGLNSICHGERRRFRHRLSLRDLEGQGIQRAKTYLEKVCGVSFPSSTAEWTRMRILAELRNVIAHADGDIERATQKERITQMVRSTTGISLRHNRYLELEPEFISETLGMMKKFFVTIHRSFPARVRAA